MISIFSLPFRTFLSSRYKFNSMKTILLPLFFLLSTYSSEISIPIEIHENQNLPFFHHTGPGYGSYLAMNINYSPIKVLWKEIEKQEGLKLKNRGEAHITVITPVEFNNSLKSFLDIKEIHRIAAEAKIQELTFSPFCVGKGEKGNLRTYFIVVKSKDLLNLRIEIQKAFIKNGGNPKDFNPESFYPHITLGFSKRDLHESDGIIKDERTCL